MDQIESFEGCESVYLEERSDEHSEFQIERQVKTKDVTKRDMSMSIGQPGSTESWEESSQLQECESLHFESKTSKKKSKSKTQDEEDVDMLLAKSQRDLDALMAKTAGSIDLLLDSTSEKIDDYILEDNIYKHVDRKKSKHQKESKEDTEDFGAKPERKKSKKHKDKVGEDSLETESISEKKHKDRKHKDEHGEEDGHGGDEDKKKKKRKKGKSTATSCATSRGASPTPSFAPTEVEDRVHLEDSGEPTPWGGKCVPLTYEKPYRVPVEDRFKQITRGVDKLDTTIHNLHEKEKLYKIRMMQQKYWHKPEARLYHTNLEYQEKPYNQMMDYLDRKERGLIPEREPHRPGPNAFVSDYDIRAEDSRNAKVREDMEKANIKRIMSAPSPRDVIFSPKSNAMKIRDTTLQSKQVQTDVPDIFIPQGPNQCVFPTRHSGELRDISTNKEMHTFMPVSQSVQTEMPIALSSQTLHTSPVQVQRPSSDVDNTTLALAASMTQMAVSRLEEARYEREREDKLIYMNNKLMDSLNSLGRCVENLAVERTPMRVNQYNAMPCNVAFYQEQLGRLDKDTRKYQNNHYLEQEPLYTPGNMSYHEHPFENIRETPYKSIGYDNYEPSYKDTKSKIISEQDVTSMLNEIKASRTRNRARTEEEFEEQEQANVYIDKFDPNWTFDKSLLEDKDRVKTAEIVHSNYMRVRHAQLRASQRNAIHGH
ncbi:unnamed protein product [Meganyctiphanes norvegica]|uniref:Uncharacterized protein n=1 Tax=Meganyctiphanes norvegica TaxID=48144 RepID=A0AAV2R7L4_MEGNR